ncbi:RebB family R body protein [Pseudoalteromonas sp. SMS1]|uniref:RebB family R body protein n=1 Tax=Pseudoalteromonas sp. SMS1 TaxID=2908894 RepID=UPI001F262ABB|nr:RebB family R body protein [Pseudoalteromonas sp. SMS1]MCF2859257.1 RebB family R body protein [Pseudoalteromonas sp. SMS1]
MSEQDKDSVPFSQQATSMTETTLAETLGLSMHNAVTSQQHAQMTTAASITNACARLLKTPNSAQTAEKHTPNEEAADEAMVAEPQEDVPNKKEKKPRFNLFRFGKNKPPAPKEESAKPDEPTETE